MNETFTIEHRGCRLSYNVRGDGPSMLFIQGVGVHGDGWRHRWTDWRPITLV